MTWWDGCRVVLGGCVLVPTGLALVTCGGLSLDDRLPVEDAGLLETAASDSGSADAFHSADAPGNEPETGADAEAAAPGGFNSDPDHVVFDQTVLRHYEVQVDPDEWAYINETAYLEETIQGTLRVDGETYGPVGVRFKGFRGSLYNCFQFDDQGNAIARVCDRLSIKVSFNEYDPDGRFFGLKKLNFHAMNNDFTKLRERLAYFLFRKFRVPAPLAVHATLTVNGEPLGLYALVEQVDGRFSRLRFADGGRGNIYKERWPASSEDPEYFKSGLETNEDDPDVDVDAMVRFARAVRTATPETMEGVLRKHTDFDALMRYLAVDRAIDHWDGITAFRCRPESEVPPLPRAVLEAQTPPLGWETCQNKNYYWYQTTTAPVQLWLVAWDMDVTFPSFPHGFPPWDEPPTECPIRQSGRPPMCDPLIEALATTLRPHFKKAGEAFLAEVFRPEAVDLVVRAWAEQIRPHLAPTDFLAVDPATLIDRARAFREAFVVQLAR